MDSKLRKKRVDWKIQELQVVVQHADANPDNRVTYATLLIRSQRACLPTERWMSNTSLYEAYTKPTFQDRIKEARDRIKQNLPTNIVAPPLLEFDFKELPPPKPAEPQLSPEEQAADKLADRIAEKVAAILLPQLEDRINDLMFSSTVSKVILQREEYITRQTIVAQTTKPRRRIDIVGLLSDQSQVVKNFIADWDVKARFILSEHVSKVDKLAPDVVLCSRFISHDAQDRAKASGSKIHYANGAATSVINLLESIFQKS